ncbi:MAG: extracellular solute-binding protein [Clostridia bacterium]|nr:extracellular solute-binding protein [Clostridia bacterium]
MKKIKYLALLCVMVLLATLALASCITPDGPGIGNDGEITNEWWKDTGELSFNSDGSVKFNNITIRLATVVSGEDTAAFNDIISDFNKEYKGKITITAEAIGQSTFESDVAQRIYNNNKAPDLIMSHQKGHKYFADNKLIQPFNQELMQQSNVVIDLNDYSAGLSQYSSLGYKDRIFSIPCDAQSMVVFYNKKLLDKYSLELPTSHQELLDVCDAYVKATGYAPIAWPAGNTQNHFYNYVVTSALVQNGAQLYDPDTKKANWTDSDNQKAMTAGIDSLRDLIDSQGDVKYAPFLDKNDDKSSMEEFANDRALFYVYFPWRIESLETYYRTRNNLTEAELRNTIGATTIANWFALDSESENADKIFVDSHFFAMSKSVEDVTKKVAIMEFVKWFTQRVDVCKKWASTGHISACKTVSQTEEYQNDEYFQRYVSNFYPNIDNFECMGMTSHYNTVLTYIKKLGYETLSDPKTSIENKLKSIQKEFNDEIDLNSLFK